MARIFITGSADGLGQFAAQQLVQEGHQVVVHARNKARGQEAVKKVPGAATVLTADLSSIAETKRLAAEANALGRFDAVIHNAGVYRGSSEVITTVNTLAPYILTSLMYMPTRLMYVSSGMHTGGQAKLEALSAGLKNISYSDTKLQLVMLTMAVARLWPDVFANAIDPGWVPTKMGGAGAPDDLEKGYRTQTWLAVSEDAGAKVSGQYFYHQKQKRVASEANDHELQNELLAVCERLTGVKFPLKG